MRGRLVALVVLVAAVALWAVVSGLLNGRSADDALAYVVVSLAFGLGLAVGLYAVVAGAATSAAVGLCLLILLLIVGQAGVAVEGSLGETVAYANAIAALAVQAAALCLIAGTLERDRGAQWFLLATAAAAVTVLVSSAAGGVGGAILVVAGAWAIFGSEPRVRWAAAAAGLGLLGAALIQGFFTAVGAWPVSLADALSARRIDLWDDAWTIATTSLWIGRGSGSFVELSPTAIDPDTTAAHSTVLQVLAELGLIGVAIMASVVVSGLVLLRSTQPRIGLVAVTAWTAVWLQGLVDYVLALPVVVFAVGVTMGVALWAGETGETAKASV